MPQLFAADRARAGSRMPSPPVVAVAGWLLPGAGYWLIGHRARALIVGVTIITLFTSGVLVGGVRAIQVPGYGENGGALYVVRDSRDTSGIVRLAEHRPGQRPPSNQRVTSDFRALLGEVGNKPWSICQVMAGPLAIAGGTGSVWASRSGDAGRDGAVDEPRGVMSHSRINEIAVLYTAVAGMLNLLVIIDAAARAARGDTDEYVPPGLPGSSSGSSKAWEAV
jgi:hypothetical protein